MEKKENQRIMLTKQLLQTAFLKLLQLKSIHAISIRELCAEAGINRTTFYYHYGSQYDLLADISGRFLDSIARCLKDADGNGQEGIQQPVRVPPKRRMKKAARRKQTADLLNAIAPEVLDSVEVMKKVRQNHIKWTFHGPYRFNWYMAFRTVSGTNSGTKSFAKSKCFAGGSF